MKVICKNNTAAFARVTKTRSFVALFLMLLLCTSASVWAQEPLPYDTSYTFQHYVNKQLLYSKLPTGKAECVFLGNSITEQGPWNELFKSKKIVNRGIGGDVTFGVLNRLNTVLDSHPEKLFLMIGINDIGRSVPVDVISKKIKEIMLQIKNKSPKTQVYLQSVLPINEEIIWYDYMKNKSKQIAKLNHQLADLAGEMGVGYIDLYSSFADEQGQLKPDLTFDGLHLSAAGYLLWRDVFKKEKIKL